MTVPFLLFVVYYLSNLESGSYSLYDLNTIDVTLEADIDSSFDVKVSIFEFEFNLLGWVELYFADALSFKLVFFYVSFLPCTFLESKFRFLL